MPIRKLTLSTLFLMLTFCIPALAQADFQSKKVGAMKARSCPKRAIVNRIAHRSTVDPWKQLAAAYSLYCTSSFHCSQFIDRDFRVITSNGIPNHATGIFPNPSNPHSISSQAHYFRVSLRPRENYWQTPLSSFPFGVALNGIPFDPASEEWFMRDRDSGWQYESMAFDGRLGIDQNNAHVKQEGAYHYHGLPMALLAKSQSKSKPVLIGYAADGFPIYAPTGFPNKRGARLRSSYRIRTGARIANSAGINPGGKYDGSFVQDYEFVNGLGDLDENNGKFAVTAEYPHGTYLYVITDSFPYIPRSFRGVPDESFRHAYSRGNSQHIEKPGVRDTEISHPHVEEEILAAQSYGYQATFDARIQPPMHQHPPRVDPWHALRRLSSF